MTHDIFISYCNVDKTIADATCSKLEAEGVRCWIAPRDILPGLSWADAVMDGISESRAMVLIFSSGANTSQYVEREVERAVGRKVDIITFRIENLAASKSMEFFLGNMQWIDASPPPPEQHLEFLLRAVQARLGASRPATSKSSAGDPTDFWATFDRGGITVVFGRFLKEFSAFEQSGLVGFGDTMALSDLRAYFESIKVRNFSVACADFVHGDILQSNLVILGGPDANAISCEIFSKLQSSLRFGDPERHEVAVHDTLTGRLYVPLRLHGVNRRGTDYGLIIKAPNPFALGKQVLLIAGSFGYGTWAGVRFCTSQQFIKHDLLRAENAIECLIQTDVVRETPLNIQLLVGRELTRA